MKRIFCLSTLLLYITLFAACVGSVPLIAKNRVSIWSVAIDQQVSLPEEMFYRGPEFALGAFGVVGYVAEYNINMKSEEKLAALMRKEQIDVSQIVRDEFITVVEARQVFPSIIPDGGDATITLTIKTYGLAYGLSSKLRPMLGVEGWMTRSGGLFIWKKYAYITNMSDQTPSYTIDELVTDPERIRQVFQLSAQIIAADLVRHMQGFWKSGNLYRHRPVKLLLSDYDENQFFLWRQKWIGVETEKLLNTINHITNEKMEVTMKQKVILTALFVFYCLVTNVLAGEAIGAKKIEEMLLRPGGWLVEWRGNTYSGVSDSIFEKHGENIVVKIHSASVNMSCERNVTIAEDAVKYDACYDTGITLHYDPADKEYPFKGESQTTNYKLKAK